jgi:FK506-binding protein 4/5
MKTARVSCWLNHAACCLKLKDFAQAISLCSKVRGTLISCHLKIEVCFFFPLKTSLIFVTSYAFFLCQVLETEPCNVKALYRRAQAYVESYDLELAKTDLRKALELDPNNK